MKITAALLSAAVIASAHEHHVHRHAHKAKRAPSPSIVVVSGPTVNAFVLNGASIAEAEVEEGVRNGTLRLADNGPLNIPPPSTSSTATSTSTSQPPPAPPTSTAAATTTTTTAPTAPVAQVKVLSGPSTDAGSGVNAPFPDGQISCSDFPDQYGAINVDWLGLGGWTGIQKPGSGGGISGILGGFANILTVTSSTCNNGACCDEGAYCSYACPAGYQKSQWPSTQGATGQSIGGLLCRNGKLHLTNPSLSSSLCVAGTQKVTVLVENTLSQGVAVCRTDYPGTESETVPLNVQAGATSNLTCPDSTEYYTWEGGQTSAQYYVNPAGVSVQDGCQWGSAGNPWGNFAPLNIGVGYSNGAAWLSVFQNAPTTDAKLQFSVEIVGDNMSGTCKYSNGQYCGSTGCSPTTGCTVSVASGTAKFIFS